jgi:hypothetical protein
MALHTMRDDVNFSLQQEFEQLKKGKQFPKA